MTSFWKCANHNSRFFRRQAKILLIQLLFGLDVIGIERDAIDRAHRDALRLVVVAYAFGAQPGIDHVDLLPGRDRA